jgi:hypothetical protein
MSRQDLKSCLGVVLLVLGSIGSIPLFAGSEVVGSLIGSRDATVDGHPAVPGQTVFGGDRLQVNNGAATVWMGGGSGMVLGRNTAAAFVRESNEVTAVLSHGRARIYYPADHRVALRLKSGNITIVPAKGSSTLAEVAITDQTLTVMTREGSLRLEGNGQTLEVPKGRAIRLVLESRPFPLGASGEARFQLNLKHALPWPGTEGAPVTAVNRQPGPRTTSVDARGDKVGKGICKHDMDEVSPHHPKKDKDEGCPNDDEEDE